MSILFGRSSQYAIQAMILISLHPIDRLLLISDISEKLDIPSPYLAKVLQILSKRGLLASVKGPGGGFKLGQPADKITLKDIVESTEGMSAFDNCVLGFARCGEDNLCPVHDTWIEIKTNISEKMLSKTIAQLVDMLKDKPYEAIEEALYFKK